MYGGYGDFGAVFVLGSARVFVAGSKGNLQGWASFISARTMDLTTYFSGRGSKFVGLGLSSKLDRARRTAPEPQDQPSFHNGEWADFFVELVSIVELARPGAEDRAGATR